MGFLSDLDKSAVAVNALIDHFKRGGFGVRELPKDEQKFGDIELARDNIKTFVEVKYDIMAGRTGNLCFEKSNGKRATGIMETLADKVYYVVPGKGAKVVFGFSTAALREYLDKSDKVTIKSGGDRKKFVLALVAIADVIGDGLCEEFFTLEV